MGRLRRRTISSTEEIFLWQVIQKYMQKNKVKVTKLGLEELKNELKQLMDKKRPDLVARLANARNEGDLKENSDYQNAKDELGMLDGRIEELQAVIANSEVVSSSSSGGADVGNKVRVKVNGGEHTFHLVGEWEADANEKKISHESPLGKALMGSTVGDKVQVEAPAGNVTYEVLGIE